MGVKSALIIALRGLKQYTEASLQSYTSIVPYTRHKLLLILHAPTLHRPALLQLSATCPKHPFEGVPVPYLVIRRISKISDIEWCTWFAKNTTINGPEIRPTEMQTNLLPLSHLWVE